MSDTPSRTRWILIPGVLPLIVVILLFVSSVLAAFILDAVLIRPVEDGGSINTLLPGFTYSVAALLKLGLFQAILLIAYTLFSWIQRKRSSAPDGNAGLRWSLLSLILPAIASLVGALVILVLQAYLDKPGGGTKSDLSQLSRTGVLVNLGFVGFGGIAAVVALLRREVPRGISVVGLIASLAAIGLHCYWELYKLGFDQDRWNDI
jgi:hypothetical protein